MKGRLRETKAGESAGLRAKLNELSSRTTTLEPEVLDALLDVVESQIKRAEALHRPEPWHDCTNPACKALTRLEARLDAANDHDH